MSARSVPAAVSGLAPVLVALAALGVREATRVVPIEPAPGPGVARVEEVAPPAWLARALAHAEKDEELRVDSASSSARLVSGRGRGGASGGGAIELEVAGAIRAGAEGLALELSLLVPDSERAVAFPRSTELWLSSPTSAESRVPGVRTCTLVGELTSGTERVALEVPAAWMRLPGGRIEAQAVAFVRHPETSDGVPLSLALHVVAHEVR